MTGFEPLIAAATAGLTGLITEVIKTKGGKLLEQLDVKVQPRLKQASRQYIENYTDRHGTLKVVCVRMDAPVKLDEVYTAVQLLERSDVRYFESADALQDLFRQTGKRGFSREATRQDGVAVASRQQYLMVLGSPGAGKSTFLRKVGLEALNALKGSKSAFQHTCIPVFLILRQFDGGKSIEQLIAEEFTNCGFEQAPELTQAALEKGKLLILLDGLDEVPIAQVDAAITQIQNLVDRYPQNRFIASCRIAAYRGGFTRFKDVVVAAFEDAQIEEFIRHWFRSEPQTANQCWELMQQPQYVAAKELAQTPLLLTLLCGVYDESQDFPKNRSAVYGEALAVLLKKWAAEKRIQRDPIYRELSPELEQILLSEIAYDSFAADRLFFSKSEAIEQIRAFLVSNLNAPKHLDGEAVLNAIEVQQGILVERARDVYSFSHLTLQEYLTAQYIVDNQQIDRLVTEHLSDETWREVFLLVAGLMPGRKGADDLLLQMEKQAQTYLNSPKLVALLQWADLATSGSEGDYKPAAKRAAAIVFANAKWMCFKVEFSIFFGFQLSNRSLITTIDPFLGDLLFPGMSNFDGGAIGSIFMHECIQNLEKSQIIEGLNFTKAIEQLKAIEDSTFREEIDEFHLLESANRVWFTLLQTEQSKTNLSKEEKIMLEDYLRIDQLMVRCKEAAVRVSAQTWEAIESRMLKP